MLLSLVLMAQSVAITENLLMLLRPQLEQQMTLECEKAVSGPESSFLNLQSICGEIARPASVCLVKEISRQGTLIQVAGEVLDGNLGPASLNVASACIGRLMQIAQPVWNQEFPIIPKKIR